jgi:hypothetical protein
MVPVSSTYTDIIGQRVTSVDNSRMDDENVIAEEDHVESKAREFKGLHPMDCHIVSGMPKRLLSFYTSLLGPSRTHTPYTLFFAGIPSFLV